MKALITLEGGKMFRVDTHNLLLTVIDKMGQPTNTRPLQGVPTVIPGRPFIFSLGYGMETTEEAVVQVIYSR